MHKTLTALALALSLGFTSPSSLLDPLWSRLSSLWNSTDEGCGADPDGCLPAPQPRSQQKEGGGCDPNGRCLPAPTDLSEAGGGCDPNGRCNPGS
jgi:hypothetical protein